MSSSPDTALQPPDLDAVPCLPRSVAARDVVTDGSGSQALAFAAREAGIGAHIVRPSTPSPVTQRAVLGYGAHVVTCEPTQGARETTAARLPEETVGIPIQPYDHPDVVTGQGTVALEQLDQAPDLDTLATLIGGAGLASGLCVAACGLDQGPHTVAPESAIVAAMRLSCEWAKLLIDASAERFGDVEQVGIILSGCNVDPDTLPW